MVTLQCHIFWLIHLSADVLQQQLIAALFYMKKQKKKKSSREIAGSKESWKTSRNDKTMCVLYLLFNWFSKMLCVCVCVFFFGGGGGGGKIKLEK